MTSVRHRLPAVERRQEILETASRVFSKSSYRGSTTAEIAREAGITEPILYRHFGSKRELYLACLDDAWATLRAVAEQAIAESPDSCLGAVTDAFVAKKARVKLVDLWIQGIGESDDPVIADALRRQIREVHAFVAELIRDGQRLGVVHQDRDPVAEAWIFVSGGFLATVDLRLGGLLGGDLERVRSERRRWMRG